MVGVGVEVSYDESQGQKGELVVREGSFVTPCLCVLDAEILVKKIYYRIAFFLNLALP